MSDDDEQAVAAYLVEKNFKIPSTHPRYEQKHLAARTAAFKKYRRDGMIRSSSWSIEEQLKRWYELIKNWEADRDKEGGNSIIRRESRSMQGTVGAMKAVIPCIKKGCLQDPPASNVPRDQGATHNGAAGIALAKAQSEPQSHSTHGLCTCH
jgi:hypothetical protein